MKIYIPNNSQQSIGGGWTFIRNFKKGMAKLGYQFVGRWPSCDIILIAGVSMTDRGEIEEAKKAGKKIVFRVDNIPRKSRNRRGRVYDKMRRFGEIADFVVFQSRWAMSYAGYLTGANDFNSGVICNGVDTEIFWPIKNPSITPEGTRYLFVQFNRDENKRWTEAAYYFHMKFRENPLVRLTMVGQFSPELIDAGFDFFAGEKVGCIPPIEDPYKLADIYREHDVLLFPAFADAAPNTVLEARACGLKVELVNPIGGTTEMLDPDLDISLDRMCRNYDSLFKRLYEKK